MPLRCHRALLGGVCLIHISVCFAAECQAGSPEVLLKSTAAGEQEIDIDFGKHVRPILSAKCFQCHGPDENTREADLRLDDSQAAYADLGGYAAIIPGDPNESELVRRIESTEEYEQMPPADSGKELSPAEIAILRQWIASGGEYREHWAFVLPQRSSLPENQASAWSNNEIDQFVLNRLEQAGLSPSSEADRYQLVRRVYLDLIGLPPTIDQADAFVSDSRPDAFERLVDQLLDSPHYGERWARRWLDLARYSDTKGYEKDQPRTMWLYRDWVIDALNQDMPFDQFTIEQIAGDMLPDATLEQRVATGFHRNTMTNEEGGIDPQEFRFHSIVDRVATTGTTWLGLTVGCAQCHTHKFDPITHTEYYQLFSFLNNSDEPKIEVPQDNITKRREEIQHTIDSHVGNLENHYPIDQQMLDDAALSEAEVRSKLLEEDFLRWRKQQRERAVNWQILVPEEIESNLPITTVQEDGSVICSGDVTKNDVFEITLSPGIQIVSSVRLEVLPHPSLPGGGPGRQVINEGQGHEGSFFLSEVEAWKVELPSDEDESVEPLAWQSASDSYSAPDKTAQHAIDGKHDTGWANFGEEGQRHTAVLRFAEPVELDSDQRLRVRLSHENYYPAGLGRFRISVTAEKGVIEATGFTDAENTALLSPEDQLTPDQLKMLRSKFLLTAPALEDQHQRIAKLKESMPAYPTALVMEQRSPTHSRQTHRHHRGEYLQPKEEVNTGVFDVLHELPEGAAMDRLTLARWLVNHENPLVARVVMNRHWEAFFGRGLVTTSEDFGYQSSYPSHPELLDWLAVEFMDCGWSLKQMHKLIVMSATYRQSSSVTPQLLEVDPENKLLSRGPGFRVEAELLRDVVLASSGLLSDKIGGPSVFPPQPPGITEAAYGALDWKVSEGEDRYRRGLYTFNKRTAPYAAFGLFDAPSGEVCVPRRTRSNTPLQSLAMLNDEVVLEAARHVAHHCLTLYGDDRAAIATELFRRCVTRLPDDEELSEILAYQLLQLERFSNSEADASQILNAGPIVSWSFSDDSAGWQARNQTEIEVFDGRLIVQSTGEDPFIGIEVSSPAGPHVLKMFASTDTAASTQIFWTTEKHQQEAPDRSASFDMEKDHWKEYSVAFKTEEPLRSIRIDTGQSPGVTKFENIRLIYGDGLLNISQDTDRDELAAWMLTARVLLNLDETITKP